ncbi:MAG: NAD(P)/FAD-dependent oxidoreductase [Actinomycetota bacterium]|nr:NAD(P)/FAD-dependent oxidoreductase [Actinomycetota bacterium]
MVVVGGGHNGLICAAYLAAAGVDVCVVEKNEVCGGALFSTVSPDGTVLERGGIDHSTIVASPIPDELALDRHGLRYLARTESAVHLFGDGARITIAPTAEETAASIAAIDRADGDAWLELAALATELGAFTAELTDGHPIPLPVALAAGRAALGAKGRPLLDLATAPVVDEVQRRFTSPHVRAMGIARTTFSGLPAWYPGTAAVLAMTASGHGRTYARPEGGSRAFVAALERAVTANGGRIVTGASVDTVRRDGDTWTVRTGGGTITARRAVVSAIPPQDLLTAMLEPADLLGRRARRRLRDAEVVAANLGQFTLAAELDRHPDLGARTGAGYEGSMLWLTADPRDAMASQTAAAMGGLADRPPVVSTFPTVADPTLAPDGRGSFWVNGYLAARLARPGGWSADATDTLAERVWATVGACLGDVRDLVTETIIATPADVSARTGAENPGQHLATTLGQMFGNRPLPGWGDHRSAIGGLYLTGAGTDPGPGISGLPGRACAHAVLADLAGRDQQGDGGVGSSLRDRLRSTTGTGRAELDRLVRLTRRARAVRRG